MKVKGNGPYRESVIIPKTAIIRSDVKAACAQLYVCFWLTNLLFIIVVLVFVVVVVREIRECYAIVLCFFVVFCFGFFVAHSIYRQQSI